MQDFICVVKQIYFARSYYVCCTCNMNFFCTVDECINHGVIHALGGNNCKDLLKMEHCQGVDKLSCDCCTTAIAERDLPFILKDPEACAEFGAMSFSENCLDVYNLCCTGQGSRRCFTDKCMVYK